MEGDIIEVVITGDEDDDRFTFRVKSTQSVAKAFRKYAAKIDRPIDALTFTVLSSGAQIDPDDYENTFEDFGIEDQDNIECTDDPDWEEKDKKNDSETLKRWWEAAKDGNVDVLEELAEDIEDVDTADGSGTTALHWAAAWGQVAAVEFLIDNTEVDIEAVNEDGCTPIQEACEAGKWDVVKLLLARGAMSSRVNSKTGWNLLHEAAIAGETGVVQEILDSNDMLIFVVDKKKKTPVDLATKPDVKKLLRDCLLRVAIKHKNIELVKKAIKDGAETQTNYVKWGDTPLHLALASSDIGIVKLLLDCRIPPDIANKENGLTPLYDAAQVNFVAGAELLVQAGANVNFNDLKFSPQMGFEMMSPLMFAASCSSTEMVEFLIARGADPLVKDKWEGMTAIHHAAAENACACIKILLSKGVPVDLATTQREWTPLMLAVQKGATEAVELLLLSGANANKQDQEGNTPLIHAVKQFYAEIDIVHALLKNKAQIRTTNAAGKSALDISPSDAKSVLLEYESKLKSAPLLVGKMDALAIAEAEGTTIVRPTGRKVALCIGIANYPDPKDKVLTAKADAEDVAACLRKLGYETIVSIDADIDAIEAAETEFTEKLDEGGAAVFYFAGLACQLEESNYLVPVTGVTMENQIMRRCFRLEDTLLRIENKKCAVNLLIIDASRGPVMQGTTKSGGKKGLVTDTPPAGSLLAYSARPSTPATPEVAAPTGSRNGAYAKQLLQLLPTPDLKLNTMFVRVRKAVKVSTDGKLEPNHYSGLQEEYVCLA